MRLYVLLSRDSENLYSAVGGAVRVWEEYPVEEAIVLHTPGVSRRMLSELVMVLDLLYGTVEIRQVDDTPESLSGVGSDRLLEQLSRVFSESCRNGGVILVSGGDKRLASTASMAAVWAASGGECPLEVVHTHYYRGPWRGLVYPYSPRRLYPVITLHPGTGGGGRERNAARISPPLTERQCSHLVMGSLPPLRCAVAETARRINELSGSSVRLPSIEEPRCGSLQVRVDGLSLPAADLCDPRGLARLASSLARVFLRLEEEYGQELRSVLAWTGLAHLMAEEDEGEGGAREYLPELVAREKVIVDSTLAFYGAHRYFWEGADLYLPECLIREVHMKVAESIKTKGGKASRIVAILAYLALKDMMMGGASVLPAATGPCDTSIPKIDPVILEDKVLASSDSGAIRYWKSHPSKKIVKRIVKVYFIPEEAARQEVDPKRDPLSLPRVYYSIVQSLLVLALMRHFRMLERLRVEVAWGGERRELRLPYKTLLKYIGYD